MTPPKTLLVVEDEVVAREGLGAILRRAGYDVILAANGEEALARLLLGPHPDLILLDMRMPKLDGRQLLKVLRSEMKPLPIPIIVMSSTIISREWAKEHRCQGYVPKPIDLEELFEEIRRCLV